MLPQTFFQRVNADIEYLAKIKYLKEILKNICPIFSDDYCYNLKKSHPNDYVEIIKTIIFYYQSLSTHYVNCEQIKECSPFLSPHEFLKSIAQAKPTHLGISANFSSDRIIISSSLFPAICLTNEELTSRTPPSDHHTFNKNIIG